MDNPHPNRPGSRHADDLASVLRTPAPPPPLLGISRPFDPRAADRAGVAGRQGGEDFPGPGIHPRLFEGDAGVRGRKPCFNYASSGLRFPQTSGFNRTAGKPCTPRARGPISANLPAEGSFLGSSGAPQRRSEGRKPAPRLASRGSANPPGFSGQSEVSGSWGAAPGADLLAKIRHRQPISSRFTAHLGVRR